MKPNGKGMLGINEKYPKSASLSNNLNLRFQNFQVLRRSYQISFQHQSVEQTNWWRIHLGSQFPEQEMTNVLIVEGPLKQKLYEIALKVILVLQGLD